VENTGPLFTAPLVAYHFPFDPSPPVDVLRAPIVSLALITVHRHDSGQSKISSAAKQMVEAAKRQEECTGGAFAFACEDQTKLAIILGWTTKEVYQDISRHAFIYAKYLLGAHRQLSCN
jgi:hypothetical protein